MDIKLPELGEGIESGDVLSILVSEGDTVEKDQGLVELETDKASVEIPSTHAGKITKIHVSEGQTLEVGGVIVTIEAGDEAESDDSPSQPQPDEKNQADDAQDESQQDEAPPDDEDEDSDEQDSGEDEDSQDHEEPKKETAKPAAKQKGQPSQPEKKSGEQGSKQVTAAQVAKAHTIRQEDGESQDNGDIVPAGPAMRRFAREVGVDLRNVEGSGEGGRITRSDILRVVRGGSKPAAAAEPEATTQTVKAPAKQPQQRETDFEQPAGEQTQDDWGAIRIAKMPKIRQTIARKMHESWTTIPRVTNFDDADVTELEQVRQASKADYATAGIKLTQMPFVIKACAMALRANPAINASIDMENGRIIYKEYVNIGIAVDTERGLVVPSLRNADRLAIPDIARKLDEIATDVRTGNFGVEQLRGSTFTISNLGAIGGTYSTPIINPPEVAILLLGRSRKMPVVVDHQFAVRLQMPLSLSYDHRLVDGAMAARFLNDVKSFLQSPSRLLLAP